MCESEAQKKTLAKDINLKVISRQMAFRARQLAKLNKGVNLHR